MTRFIIIVLRNRMYSATQFNIAVYRRDVLSSDYRPDFSRLRASLDSRDNDERTVRTFALILQQLSSCRCRRRFRRRTSRISPFLQVLPRAAAAALLPYIWRRRRCEAGFDDGTSLGGRDDAVALKRRCFDCINDANASYSAMHQMNWVVVDSDAVIRMNYTCSNRQTVKDPISR